MRARGRSGVSMSRSMPGEAHAACRRGAPRCQARSSGRNALGGHAAIAFVVPSAAATSASGRACAISSRTSSAVTCGRSAASTATPVARRVALERERHAGGEVAPAVVERVGAERARRGVHVGVRRDDADRETGLQAGPDDAPQQEQHEVRARIAVQHIGQTRLAAGQRLHGHQRQPPAMGTGYHRAESMSPAPPFPPLRLGYKASAEQFAPAAAALVRRRRRAPRPRQRRRLGSLPAVPARRRALARIAAVARRARRVDVARPRSARACSRPPTAITRRSSRRPSPRSAASRPAGSSSAWAPARR